MNPTRPTLRGDRRWLALAAPALAFALLLCLPARASDDTLLKVHGSGRIVLGARDTAAPVSYLDANGAHVGYHMDICARVVQAIRQRFDMPSLTVVTVPTTLATRLALLNNGTIDIDCGHNAVTGASLQHALHAHATLMSDTRAMTTVDRPELSLSKLDGLNVGAVSGSTVLPVLRARARQSQIKVTETLGRTALETFRLLESGRVDLIVLGEPYLLSHRASADNPARYVLLDGVLRTEPVALIVRLSDDNLLALVNEVIDAMMHTGEMERIYLKWFVEPAPGARHGLGLRLSPALRALFANPGSEMQQF